MQLNERSVCGALAVAASGLLSPAAQAGTTLDSALLLYQEADRVSAAEAVVSLKTEFKEDQFLRAKLVYDALTGASATGATASNEIQTFTRPSGRGSYTVAPGTTPLDDTFHDTRFALSASIDRPLDRTSRLSFGVNGSTEYDYLSLGANVGVTRDFDRRNRTVSVGLSFARDTIDPEGGVPVAFGQMEPAGSVQPRRRGTESKTVIDGIVGLSQVLGRSTLGRVNYSFSRSSGYQTDPFKLLSVVASSAEIDAGSPRRYLFESRPDSRAKHSIFGQLRHRLATDVVDVNYRYLWDSWGLSSHTIDASYTWWATSRVELQPRARFYHQTAVDFFRAFLVDGQPLPDHASADYRIGDMQATTLGLSAGYPFGSGQRARVAVEHYSQSPTNSGPEPFGTLTSADLSPSVSAWMLRVGYSREW